MTADSSMASMEATVTGNCLAAAEEEVKVMDRDDPASVVSIPHADPTEDRVCLQPLGPRPGELVSVDSSSSSSISGN